MDFGFPKEVEEWTLYHVEQLVDAGYFETDIYDFKERISNKNDPQHKIRLRKTACAFANSNGGFIVFGIADKASGKIGRDRIIGVDSLDDLARVFGEQICNCEPTIYFKPQNPPISLISENNKAIFIVHIPASDIGPHGFKEKEAFCYYKRTNKGNEPMTFSELSSSFHKRINVRSNLRLLMNCLVEYEESLERYEYKIIKNGNLIKKTTGTIVGWSPALAEIAISQLYSFLQKYDDLLERISGVIWFSRMLYSLTEHSRLLEVVQGPDKANENYSLNIKPKIDSVLPGIKKLNKELLEIYKVID